MSDWTEQQIRDLVLQVLHDEGADMQDDSQVPPLADNDAAWDDPDTITMPLMVETLNGTAYKKASVGKIVDKSAQAAIDSITPADLAAAWPDLPKKADQAETDATAYATDQMVRDALNGVLGTVVVDEQEVAQGALRYVPYTYNDNGTTKTIRVLVYISGDRRYAQTSQFGSSGGLIVDENGKVVTSYANPSFQEISAYLTTFGITLQGASLYYSGSDSSGYVISCLNGEYHDAQTVQFNTNGYMVVSVANGALVTTENLDAISIGTETIITDITQL